MIETTLGPRVWDDTANLRNFIRECSGGFHRFDNRNQRQVTDLRIKIKTLMAQRGRVVPHLLLPGEREEDQDPAGPHSA